MGRYLRKKLLKLLDTAIGTQNELLEKSDLASL